VLLCLLGFWVTVRESIGSFKDTDLTTLSVRQAQTVFHQADCITSDPSGQSILVWDRNGQCLGRIVESAGFSFGYAGYAGSIPLRIALDPNDKVIALNLGQNHETPSYITYLRKRGFLEQWDGLSAGEVVARQVDAISGATMSCKAISNTLRHSLAITYDIPLPADLSLPEYYAVFSAKKVLFYVVMLVGLLYSLKPKLLGIHRRFILLLSVFVLGILNGKLISLAQIHAWIINGIAFPEHLPLVCLTGISLLVPLLYRKNIYCVYLCPFGAAQELLGQTVGTKYPMPKKITNFLLACGSVLLIFTGFTLLAGIDFDLSLVEPFAVFSMRAISFWVLLLAGTCMLASVYYPRCWCRFICPIGRIINLFQWGIVSYRKKRQNGSSIEKGSIWHCLSVKIG
jgi:hypothetical protein